MRKASHLKDYEQRLNRVITYIYDHLNEPLDLLKLADIACMSPYHWHRLYHALYGETIADTVKRLRLQKAATYLSHTELSPAIIAKKSGYPNLQSFTRLFKQEYGLPPAQYRKKGNHHQFQLLSKQSLSEQNYPVIIRHVSDLKIVALNHQGSYIDIGKAFYKLFTWLGAHDLVTTNQRMLGIYFDDPSITAEKDLKSQAAMVIENHFNVNPPIISSYIHGGLYAVLRYIGPYASMRAAYQWLYGQWLPQSAFETTDQPIFEEYINNPRDVSATELITDIYLPLASSK
ncbi:MAG: AraC family transcriptional regulator [Alphaproteobacteria bacterium]|nr:AraC family transcriptional regulator [Alphaproteobacteria bacterium]